MKKKITPKVKPGGIHAGHRHRMRMRLLAVENIEKSGFCEHEILEILLYYAIPRKDVNETAHYLINEFGSLGGVLDASEEELCTIPGVGPSTARFLRLIPQILTQIQQRSEEHVPFILRTSKDVQELLTNQLYTPLEPGQTLLVLLNIANVVIRTHRYKSFESIDPQDLFLCCTRAQATACALIEYVPDCTDFPLPGRIEMLTSLAERLTALLCPLWDYFTVDGLGHTPRSYTKTGQLLLP